MPDSEIRHNGVRQLAGLGKHGARNLTQGVETLDDRIEHNYKMLPRIEVLDVPLAAILTAETEDFRPVKQI